MKALSLKDDPPLAENRNHVACSISCLTLTESMRVFRLRIKRRKTSQRTG